MSLQDSTSPSSPGSDTPISLPGASLILSSTSFSNATIQCDALGIHYQLSSPTEDVSRTQRIKQSVVTIKKWVPAQERDAVVAEWERNLIHKDRLRLHDSNTEEQEQQELEFVSVDDIFPRTFGIPMGSVLCV